MGLTKNLSDFITENYQAWHNYTRKLGKFQSPDVEDLLHEVLVELLDHHEETLESLFKHNPQGLSHYVVSVIKNNIYYKSAPFHQNYYKQEKMLDRNVNANLLNLSNEDEAEPFPDRERLIEKISMILDKIGVDEHKRRIFEFRYFEGRQLKEWEGSDSVSHLSKTCKKVCKSIREYVISRNIRLWD